MHRAFYMGTDARPLGTTKKMTVGLFFILVFIGGIFFNPAVLFPPLHVLRLQYIFGLIASLWLVLGLLKLKESEKLNWTGVQTSYTIFQAVTLVGILIWSQSPADSMAFFSNKSLKTLLMLVLIGSLAGHPETFRKTFGFFMLAVAAFQVHSLGAIFAGVEFPEGRFDSWVGQISNADEVGVFFASMVPLQLELSLNAPNRTKKLLFLVSAVASIFIMVKTQTRSAFLALVVVLFLWVITKGRPGAKLKIVASFAIIVFLFGSVMEKSGTTFLARMGTIFSESSFKADINVKSRLYLWGQGIRIWSQFPVWGCGLAGMDAHQTASEDGISNTRDYTRGLGLTEFSLHQSFIQILAERGLSGLIADLFFIHYIFFCLKRTQELEGRDLVPDGFHGIAKGLQLSMIATLIGAMFTSVQESWILIFLAAFSSALYSATCLHLASTRDEIYTPGG